MNNEIDSPAQVAESLRRHLELCREVLAVVEKEEEACRQPTAPPHETEAKKVLLPRLNQSLDQVRKCRAYWQQLGPVERARHKDVALLLKQNQEVTMRILNLDRENEQSLLRRGLVPSKHLPPANRQRPHFVADLYRRNKAG